MIGFKYGNLPAKVAQEQEATPFAGTTTSNADEIVRLRGLELAWQYLHEYLNSNRYPMIQGDERDKWIVKRLRQVKERYFDTI